MSNIIYIKIYSTVLYTFMYQLIRGMHKIVHSLMYTEKYTAHPRRLLQCMQHAGVVYLQIADLSHLSGVWSKLVRKHLEFGVIRGGVSLQ